MGIQDTFGKVVRIVKQSLNGEEQEYTQGSISKAVFLLAIPMILELSLESVFAVVDMFFVSKSRITLFSFIKNKPVLIVQKMQCWDGI
jgi:hypothetical protein